MKASEVVERLRGELPDSADARAGTFLGGQEAYIHRRCVAIARALGVAVEPDEPPLPEMVEFHDSHGPCIGRGNLWLSLDYLGGGTQAGHRLARELVVAYNGRLRWRTGPPPRPGQYLTRASGNAERRLLQWDGLQGWWDGNEACHGLPREWCELP